MTSTKYPSSGLTDQEAAILEAAGWHETAFESLPPPWSSREGEMMHPRDALALVVARTAETLREGVGA